MQVRGIINQRINSYPTNTNRPEANKTNRQPSFKSWTEVELASAYIAEFGCASVVFFRFVAFVIKSFTNKPSNDNFKLK